MADKYHPIAGMMGLSDIDDITGFRPKDWTQGVFKLAPNGKAQITALTGFGRKAPTKDVEFNWWEKSQPSRSFAVTGVYKNTALTSAYGAGDDLAAGSVVYIKLTTADNASEIRPRHTVVCRDGNDLRNDVFGSVVDVVRNGVKTYVAVQLREADGGAGRPSDLSDCDTVIIAGTTNPEGSQMPDAITYQAERKYNFTQIFEDPLDMTRTAIRTEVRGIQDVYQEAKQDLLLMHQNNIERAFLMGVKAEWDGSNGNKERSTGGIRWFLKENASTNLKDFRYEAGTAWSGKTWDAVGHDYIDVCMEELFLFRAGNGGESRKMVWGGNAAIAGWLRAIRKNASWQILTKDRVFGFEFSEYITPFGSLYLATHPLFNEIPSLRNTLLFGEPNSLKVRYVDDTRYKADPQREKAFKEGGHSAIDGIKESFFTEAGFQIANPETWMMISGVGLDNEVT